jgi:hypothetical protein
MNKPHEETSDPLHGVFELKQMEPHKDQKRIEFQFYFILLLWIIIFQFDFWETASTPPQL